MSTIKSVAVIGAGPSGAAAAEALRRSNAFDVIKVFERRAEVGGAWNFDPDPGVPPADPMVHPSLVDPPVQPPSILPARTPKQQLQRWTTAPVYETLTTNVNVDIMSYTYVHFSQVDKTPPAEDTDPMFPSAARVLKYIQTLHARHADFLVLNTTLERASKKDSKWFLTLRRSEPGEYYWYEESFDALVVATGIYWVPKIPSIPGLKEYNRNFPGCALHSKYFRSVQAYKNKTVIIVGNGITALDLIRDLMPVVSSLTVSHRSVSWMYPTSLEGVEGISVRPELSHIDPSTGDFFFKDGGAPVRPDAIIFATGYHVSFPFLSPPQAVHNHDSKFTADWVPGTYLHTFWREDPTLSFVGLVQNSVSFRIFEYQAALIASYLSGKLTLPPISEMEEWEKKRLEEVDHKTALFHYNKYPGSVEFLNQLHSILSDAGGDSLGLLEWQDEWTPRYLAGVNERKRRVDNLKTLHLRGSVI
ncbi:hypothetical protein CEP52_001348 [Fusarium oligoseptatum]|uniref:Thiol-specific monooxygenase n=1 Tax=Fusarium oligoseptatum TaxID=2604345 RepID=A0A428UJD1_9HYPO|nr:hypothetical protein CEP52_001348 [Fusarium oligoseptatum]